MANKPSQLSGNLIARKGDATPSTPTPKLQAVPPAVVEQLPVEQPQPRAKTSKPPRGKTRVKAKAIPRGVENTIAVTVRLDEKRYRKLKHYGVDQRKTNQEILVNAIDAYLA